ncbi:DUF3144 domain-containing protein [Asticcacaulis sp. EMRT-3]|uniref:DUF3144 domain-containing protein n=1 Tax=Asticcacaulis sp. EMRT-3 TaxID=3040349 RepID=UPI0024AE9A33|nr:DUF3144 domain-containing protein [Asticcacaulis sp. EMRT-3]MDI7775570.1 DUF3144 domain-containing protein [Asticcacaulis sp. EMRT-3]
MAASDQEQFVSMASSHIDLANSHHKSADPELVAVAFNHAAARYSVFVVSQVEGDNLVPDRDTIIMRLTDQYRDMLNQHYDEYARLAGAG